MPLPTPHYLIDERRMLPQMETIRRVQASSGAKCLLALKCFSSWCAFDFMKQYLSGTTSSSLYEARLGHEKFGGETHGYSVAYDDDEIGEIGRYCDKVIYNSLSQLERHRVHVTGTSIGIRLNPEISRSAYPLSDPAARFSRLGVRASQLPSDLGARVEGAMTHINCDNADFDSFCAQLDQLSARFGKLFAELTWLSLGGGISFTTQGYPVAAFCRRLADFSAQHRLKLYLEPGEAAVTGSTSLVVQVLDIVHNEVPTLIVDAGVETHLLDVLVYGMTPELAFAKTLPRDWRPPLEGPGHVYRVCGRTCLAGDHFGTYVFERPIEIAERLRFPDVGGYSMVKQNFFNGIRMPSIYLRSLDGETRFARRHSYEEFRDALS